MMLLLYWLFGSIGLLTLTLPRIPLYRQVVDPCLLTEVPTQERHHWPLENPDWRIKTCSKAMIPRGLGLR